MSVQGSGPVIGSVVVVGAVVVVVVDVVVVSASVVRADSPSSSPLHAATSSNPMHTTAIDRVQCITCLPSKAPRGGQGSRQKYLPLFGAADLTRVGRAPR